MAAFAGPNPWSLETSNKVAVFLEAIQAGLPEHVSRSSSALLSRVQVVPTSNIVQTERQTSWFSPKQRDRPQLARSFSLQIRPSLGFISIHVQRSTGDATALLFSGHPLPAEASSLR